MKILSILSLVLMLSLAGMCQGAFSETNYSLVSQGSDSSGLHVKTYTSNLDASYRMKKMYLDSSATELISKSFYKSDILEGPITLYAKGDISLKGTYKNGKWDGERLTYRTNVLLQKAYYHEGVKTGTWDEFNVQGHLKRRISYDSAGNVTTDVRY
jgi:antitoxin component YwqK of YwqJK toxin-antitoxin module